MTRSLAVLFSSLKMAVATFCSRILGLVREQVMASLFGASGLTDAFLVAYRIPNLLRDLFAEGAFSAAFVPTFVEANKEGQKKANELLWTLFYLLFFVTGIISFITIVFAPEIISVFAPSFKDNLEKFETTVLLTRLMAPFLCFVSLAALFMGALNSLKIFFIPSLAPAFFNIVMIIAMFIFPSYLIEKGYPAIYSLGLGVFLGGIVQALVQLPLLIKNNFIPFAPKNLLNERSKKVFKKLGPGLIGFAATQINLLINTVLASGTVVGAVSWLSYSFRLFQLPVGILSVSLGNSNLVHFSNSWKEGKEDEARGYLLSSYFLSYLFVLPAFIVLYVLSDEIVRVIFERGKFDGFATLMTAKALRWYALGLPFYGIYKILVPTFYAIDRQKIPVYSSIFSIIVNISFCVTLTPVYGFEVLALGTTISMFVNSLLLIMVLKKDLSLSLKDFFGPRILKLLFTCAILTLGVEYISQFIFHYKTGFWWDVLFLSATIGLIYFLYGLVLFILGERSAVLKILKKLQSRVKRIQ